MKWTEVFDKQAYDEVLESLKASAQAAREKLISTPYWSLDKITEVEIFYNKDSELSHWTGGLHYMTKYGKLEHEYTPMKSRMSEDLKLRVNCILKLLNKAFTYYGIRVKDLVIDSDEFMFLDSLDQPVDCALDIADKSVSVGYFTKCED